MFKRKKCNSIKFSKYYIDVIKNNKKKNQNIIFSKKVMQRKFYIFSIFYIKSLSRFRRFIIHKLLQVFNILNLKSIRKSISKYFILLIYEIKKPFLFLMG